MIGVIADVQEKVSLHTGAGARAPQLSLQSAEAIYFLQDVQVSLLRAP